MDLTGAHGVYLWDGWGYMGVCMRVYTESRVVEDFLILVDCPICSPVLGLQYTAAPGTWVFQQRRYLGQAFRYRTCSINS